MSNREDYTTFISLKQAPASTVCMMLLKFDDIWCQALIALISTFWPYIIVATLWVWWLVCFIVCTTKYFLPDVFLDDALVYNVILDITYLFNRARAILQSVNNILCDCSHFFHLVTIINLHSWDWFVFRILNVYCLFLILFSVLFVQVANKYFM